MSRAIFVSVAIAFSAGCGGKVIFDTGGATGNGGASGTTHGATTGKTTSAGVETGPSTVSSTSSGPSTIISCGKNSCDGNVQECCANPNGALCVMKGANCTGLALHCSSAANCPSPNLCCAHPSMMGGAFVATCEAKCQQGGPGGGPQLCATSAECTNGAQCVNGPGGIKFCLMGGGPPPGGGTSGGGPGGG